MTNCVFYAFNKSIFLNGVKLLISKLNFVTKYKIKQQKKEEEAAEDMETGGANEEEQEEVESEQLIDIQIPRVKTDLGKEVHFVKLPNFLSVESRYSKKNKTKNSNFCNFSSIIFGKFVNKTIRP